VGFLRELRMVSRPVSADPGAPDVAEDDERSDGTGPNLDEEEHQKAKDEESLGANVTCEAIRREGLKELARPPQALAWSGLSPKP
jgi:hypothetical protein